MEFRFVAYDRLGAWRGVLPNPLEAIPVTALNDLATLTLSYDRLSPNHQYLDNDPEVAVERLYNGAWVEIPYARFRCLSVDFDHLNDVPVRSYTFIHIGEALSGVTVYSANGRPLTEDGAVQWRNASPGKVISNIWADALTRGWKGFSLNFTSTTDSAGQPWANTFTMAFDVDTSLSGVLHRLVALGLCDYRWVGRQLQLFNADTTLGVDQTITPTPVSIMSTGKPAGVDSAPEETDTSNLATHVIVLGEEGKRWVFPTGYIAPEGRRELVLSYSGVNDEGTARLLATPSIYKGANELKNTTRQFHLTPDTKVLPFETYNVGNWVWVQRGLIRERMRIRVISLQIDSNGVQGFVTLGDKIDETLEIMYEQIQRLTGGVSNQGTSTPGKPPGRLPKDPTNLDATATPYVDNYGRTVGVVLLGFVHDHQDAAGNPVQIDYYPTWYRPTGTTEWVYMMQIEASARSGTFSPLPAYDRFGQPAFYDFALAAMSAEGIRSGTIYKFGVAIGQDTVAPPVPDFAQSNVKTKFGTITIDWNGKGRSESNVLVDMPADLKEVRIYQYTDAAGGGKTRVGVLLAAYEKWVTDQIAAGTTRWYGLSAVDITGNESAVSPVFSITPTALVDEESIRNELEQAFDDISDANVKADNAVGTANSANAAAGAAQAAADAAAAKAREVSRLLTNKLLNPEFEDDFNHWAPSPAANWSIVDATPAPFAKYAFGKTSTPGEVSLIWNQGAYPPGIIGEMVDGGSVVASPGVWRYRAEALSGNRPKGLITMIMKRYNGSGVLQETVREPIPDTGLTTDVFVGEIQMTTTATDILLVGLEILGSAASLPPGQTLAYFLSAEVVNITEIANLGEGVEDALDLANSKGKTYIQDTAPLGKGKSYRWKGTPHASASEEIDEFGTVLRTNLATNPTPGSNTGWGTTSGYVRTFETVFSRPAIVCTRAAAGPSTFLWYGRNVGLLTTSTGTPTNMTGLPSVLPGETVYVSLEMGTARANTRGSLNIRWFNSAGTNLSTISSPYQAMSVNTWETFTYSGVAPATAAYFYVENVVSTLTGNTVGGEKSWAGRALLSTTQGSYFDGNSPSSTLGFTNSLWIDTTLIGGVPGNIPKRWNGTNWVEVTDKTAKDAAQAAAQAKADALAAANKAQAALEAAGEAQSSANGKNKIYYTEPLGTVTLLVGDTWFDDTNGLIKVWNGEAWAVPTLGTNAFKDLAITNAKILNLDGAKISADSIRSVSLISKSIGTDKLLIGQDAQLVDNAFFEGGLAAWDVTKTANDQVSVVTAPLGYRSKAMLFETNVSSGSLMTVMSTTPIVVTPGETLLFKLNMHQMVQDSYLIADLRLYYRYANGSALFTSIGLPDTPVEEWTEVTRTAVVPANAVSVTVGMRMYPSTQTGEILYLGGFEVFKLTSSVRIAPDAITVTHIANGAVSETKIAGDAITTPKIKAGAVVAASVAALAIETGKLAANAVTAAKVDAGSVRTVILIADSIITSMLAADAITAKHTITGATYQTVSTPLRGVKINSAGIKGYNSAGVNTLDFSTSTGDMLATGIFQTAVSGQRVRIWDRSNLAAVDLYPGTSDAHGAIYAFVSGSTTATEVRHFTDNSAWTAGLYMESTGRVFLNGGPSRNSSYEIASNGNISINGRYDGGHGPRTTFCAGATGQVAGTSGGWTVTYGSPAAAGNRNPLCQADGFAPVQTKTSNCSASAFTFNFNTADGAGNSNVSFRYFAWNS